MGTHDATTVSGEHRGWIRRLGAECWNHRRTAVGALTVTVVAAIIDIVFPLLTKVALDAASAGESTVTKVITGVARTHRRPRCRPLRLPVRPPAARRPALARRAARPAPRAARVAAAPRRPRPGPDPHRPGGLPVDHRPAAGPGTAGDGAAVGGSAAPVRPRARRDGVAVAAADRGRARRSSPRWPLVVYLVRPALFAATWSAQQRAADLAQHVEETVTGVRVVKGFGQEARAVDQLEDHRPHALRRTPAGGTDQRPVRARRWPRSPSSGMVGVDRARRLPRDARVTITVGTFLAFATYVTTMTGRRPGRSPPVVIMAQLSRAAVERVYERDRHRARRSRSAAPGRPARRSARRRTPRRRRSASTGATAACCAVWTCRSRRARSSPSSGPPGSGKIDTVAARCRASTPRRRDGGTRPDVDGRDVDVVGDLSRRGAPRGASAGVRRAVPVLRHRRREHRAGPRRDASSTRTIRDAAATRPRPTSSSRSCPTATTPSSANAA